VSTLSLVGTARTQFLREARFYRQPNRIRFKELAHFYGWALILKRFFMNNNEKQAGEIVVNGELQSAFDVLFDGTDFKKFNKGFRKFIRGMMFASMEGGLAQTEEIGVL